MKINDKNIDQILDLAIEAMREQTVPREEIEEASARVEEKLNEQRERLIARDPVPVG